MVMAENPQHYFCDLCEKRQPCTLRFTPPPQSHPSPRYEIVQCNACGLVFYPIEKTQNLHALYSEKYFQGGEYSDYQGDEKIHEWNFKKRIAYLRKLSPKGTLFEIGSAYGFFLNMAKQFWESKGIEISADAVAWANKRFDFQKGTLIQGDLLKTDLPSVFHRPMDQGFDLVCMWDTLEHLDHPKSFLRTASRLLKPGGHLVFTTLDSGSVLAKMRGPHWRQIHPPTHLYYFDRERLKKYVESLGLQIIDQRSIGITRSYRSMAHGLFAQKHNGNGLAEPSRHKWIYQLLTCGEKLDFPIYLNTGDLVQVTARK